MIKLLWQQMFFVSQPEIEVEHRQLFALIGRYYAALKTASLSKHRHEILEEGISLARRHFKHEGAILMQYDHPGVRDHLQEHERILSDLNWWMQRGVSHMATKEDFHVLDDLLVHLVRENGWPELRALDRRAES